ncbi:MAG: SDR family NAD(P)-dependent oxidoreductase [Candidatus Eisenbacteria bacterium]|nr:SDR family NAD(P)-dependent oxidoreductase [Candidatus Eisenbacteria bacterium]
MGESDHTPILEADYFEASLEQSEAAIINITSGLAFAPLALMPVYCATKAALHSFSLSLRHQLFETSVRVYEVAPPIVDTKLDKGARGGREQQDRGIKPEVVATATLAGLASDEVEIVIGMANNLRSDPVGMFKRMNA